MGLTGIVRRWACADSSLFAGCSPVVTPLTCCRSRRRLLAAAGLFCVEVLLDDLVEGALGGEDEVDGVAAGALAAGVRGGVVGHGLTCGRALAVAMARPQTRMTGRSTMSSPT